jgi:hypothetical protein
MRGAARPPWGNGGSALGECPQLKNEVLLTRRKQKRVMTEGMEALRQLGEQQREQHFDSNPAEMFLCLLQAAFISGKCHLRARTANLLTSRRHGDGQGGSMIKTNRYGVLKMIALAG